MNTIINIYVYLSTHSHSEEKYSDLKEDSYITKMHAIYFIEYNQIFLYKSFKLIYRNAFIERHWYETNWHSSLYQIDCKSIKNEG